MKNLGQTLVNGGILIAGFLILVFVLTSLPGRKSSSAAAKSIDSTPQVQESPAAPTGSVPSAIRGIERPSPAQQPSASQRQAAPQQPDRRLRQDRYEPTETPAQMEARIKRYLDSGR